MGTQPSYLSRQGVPRIAIGGDPSGMGAQLKRDVATIRKAGLKVLAYSSQWKHHPELKRTVMASCHTWADAEQAVDQGWRAAVHVDALAQTTGVSAQGSRYVLCPHDRMKQEGKEQIITCNDCRMCDAADHGPDIIVFIES